MNNEKKHKQWTVLAQKHFFLSKTYFYRMFVLCVFLTLSLCPITAQTNSQQSTPDYISQAEAGVKKYYPQYEEYFKGIFKEIKWLWDYEMYLLNKEIKKSLTLWWKWLNEKEIINSILISLENIIWEEKFIVENWISKNSKEYQIWAEIGEWFYKKSIDEIKKIEWFKKEIESLNKKLQNMWINEIENEYIQISEKHMQLLKNWLLNYWELRRTKGAQNWIEWYIEILKRSNRTPSKIGQIYIDEYNKINKK